MSSRCTLKVEICCATGLKAVLDSAFEHGLHCEANHYDVCVTAWSESEETHCLQQADVHVVFVDSAPWMRQALVQSIIRAPRQCPVQRMILFGFCEEIEPAGEDRGKIPVNRQHPLGLLFEGFHVEYQRLPLRLEMIRNEVASCISRVSAGILPGHWQRNFRRVRTTLRIVKGLGYADNPMDAWSRLDSLSGSGNTRLREEHDIKVEKGEGPLAFLERLLRFQTLIDLYYLAVARSNGRQPYTFLIIEDNPGFIRSQLKFLASATGDRFYVTKSGSACHKLAEKLQSKDRNQRSGLPRDGFSWPSELFDNPIVPYGEQVSENECLAPDAVLVDLILWDDAKKLLVHGESIIRQLQERFRELPVFVVTRSEEPDVLTRCVKIRGADRVVPKRRLLRLPYTFLNYLHEEVSPLLSVLDGTELSSRLVAAYRTWNSCPGILWHGEKTVHAAEHTLEHSLGLWKLAHQLLSQSWDHMQDHRHSIGLRQYYPKELFGFLMSIWLHDIGSKGSEAYQMADQVRSRHSWISGELIHRNPELYRLERGEEADFVELLCAYHQSCAPFSLNDPTKESVRGLFHQSLEEIEESCKWNLLEWTALLRLLDAIEHNWRRVGTNDLFMAKKIDIDIDRKYYSERAATQPDAAEYAKWLDVQESHMQKHLSVLRVDLRTNRSSDGRSIVFWPEYTFADCDDAKDYLGEIGIYALQEWHATGSHIAEKMGIRFARTGEVSHPETDNCYAVHDFWCNEICEQTLDPWRKSITSKKNDELEKKIHDIETGQKQVAWRVWSNKV